MTTSFGVSVGSDSVRTAAKSGSTSTFTTATVDTPAPEASVRAIGRVIRDLRSSAGQDSPVVVTYSDFAQRNDVVAELEAQSITGVETASETRAVMRLVGETGIADGYDTIALYDLGATGLSVTIVDLDTGRALGSARSTVVSGDFFDRVVREHLIRNEILSVPQDEQTDREITLFCRNVKESLSHSSLAQTPGGGTLLMTRGQFEQIVYLALEESAKIISEVGLRCQRTARAVVAVGGGAYTPVVQTVLTRWLDVPVLVPPDPELAMAQGAALIATDSTRTGGGTDAFVAADAADDTAPDRAGVAAPRTSDISAVVATIPPVTVFSIAQPAAAATTSTPAVTLPGAGSTEPVAAGTSVLRRVADRWRSKFTVRSTVFAGGVIAAIAMLSVVTWANSGKSTVQSTDDESSSSSTEADASASVQPTTAPALAPSTAPTSTAVSAQGTTPPVRTTSRAPYTYPRYSNTPAAPYVAPPVPTTGPTVDISAPFQLPPLQLPPIPRIYIPGF